MRYEARVTAYDMLDQICCAVVIFRTEDDPLSRPEVALRASTTVPGTGEVDPAEWIRDALVAILETL